MTDLARNIYIRQEVHLNCDRAITRTVLTTPTFDVKGETPLLITTNLGL